MRKVSVALLAMLSLAVPSFSQDATPESECREAFKAADVIQDGVLTHTEISKAKLPPELAKATLVGRQEFMATCVKTAQAKMAEKQAASAPPAESPQGMQSASDSAPKSPDAK